MSKNEQKAKAGVNPRRKAGFRLFLLTTPILIGIFIFSYLPLLGWIYAFFDYKPGLSIWDCTFTGLKLKEVTLKAEKAETVFLLYFLFKAAKGGLQNGRIFVFDVRPAPRN